MVHVIKYGRSCPMDCVGRMSDIGVMANHLKRVIPSYFMEIWKKGDRLLSHLPGFPVHGLLRETSPLNCLNGTSLVAQHYSITQTTPAPT